MSDLKAFLRGFYSTSQLRLKLQELKAGLSERTQAEREARIRAIEDIFKEDLSKKGNERN